MTKLEELQKVRADAETAYVAGKAAWYAHEKVLYDEVGGDEGWIKRRHNES